MAGHLAWLAGTGVWHEGSACGPRGPSGCGHHSSRLSRGHAVVASVDGPWSCPPVASESPHCEHVGVWGHSQGGKSASSLRVSLLAVGEGGVSRLRPRILPVTSPSPGEQAVHTARVAGIQIEKKRPPLLPSGPGPPFLVVCFPSENHRHILQAEEGETSWGKRGFGCQPARVHVPPASGVHPYASLGWPVKRGQSV